MKRKRPPHYSPDKTATDDDDAARNGIRHDDDDDDDDAMRKRSLEYRPNLRLLWEFMRMGSGVLMPSLRFLAVLAWGRRERHSYHPTLGGTRLAPPNFPPDLWTGLAWVLMDAKSLVVPSGVHIHITETPWRFVKKLNYITWHVSVPDPTARHIAEPVKIRYAIARDGLHIITDDDDDDDDDDSGAMDVQVPVPRGLRGAGLYALAGPLKAICKRGRWFAPNPTQVEIVKLPAAAGAQDLLNWLWECQAGSEWHSLNAFHYREALFVRGMPRPSHIRGPLLEGNKQCMKNFGAMVWLFLKGYIHITHSVGGNPGKFCKLRTHILLRDSNKIVHTSRTMPMDTRDILRRVYKNSFALVRIEQKIKRLFRSRYATTIHLDDVRLLFKDIFGSFVTDVVVDHLLPRLHICGRLLCFEQ